MRWPICSTQPSDESEGEKTLNAPHPLASLPASDWRIGQVVVFDWFDGPRHGVARLTKLECEFVFELLAERHNPDGLDERLFRVGKLPPGSVAEVLQAVHSLGSPANAVWIPLWQFDDEEERLRADRAIDHVLGQRTDTGLVIGSSDMTTFHGCWPEDGANGRVQDWFSLPGIS
jgi:hypothetical protein